MIIRSSDQVPRNTLLKRFPIPRNFGVTREFEHRAREDLAGAEGALDPEELPMRHLGSFNPASGVGGAGVWRFLPTDFKIRSHTETRYGKSFVPADMTI